MTSLLGQAKLANLTQLVRETVAEVGGPMAEVGVYRGGSAKAMLEAVDQIQKRRSLYLFDTFAGLPEPGPKDAPGKARAGQFACGFGEVLERLEAWSAQLHLFVGLFPGSAANLEYLRWSFVHVDVDLEASVQAACEWFFTCMNPGGVMLFDDYGSREWRGVKPTVDQYAAAHCRCVRDLGTCQAVVQF